MTRPKLIPSPIPQSSGKTRAATAEQDRGEAKVNSPRRHLWTSRVSPRTWRTHCLLPSPKERIADQRLEDRQGERWTPGRQNCVKGLSVRMRKHLCRVMSLPTGCSAHIEESASLATVANCQYPLWGMCEGAQCAAWKLCKPEPKASLN